MLCLRWSIASWGLCGWSWWVRAPQKQGAPCGMQSKAQHGTSPFPRTTKQTVKSHEHQIIISSTAKWSSSVSNPLEKEICEWKSHLFVDLISLPPGQLRTSSPVDSPVGSHVLYAWNVWRNRSYASFHESSSVFMSRDLQGHSVLYSSENHQMDTLPSTHR